MKKAIVIGSGIGGLAIALRLKAKGYDVHVFEKNQYLGGKIHEFRDYGYRFDTGPSLFTLPNLIYELFDLFGKNHNDYIEVVELESTCDYFFPDGMQIKTWSNKDKFKEQVVQSGVQYEKIDQYLSRQSFVYENTSEFFLFNSIHKLKTYLGAAGLKSLKALSKLDAFITMNQRNTKSFGGSNLTQLFNRYATYNGSDPYRAPATLNMIAHLEHNTGAFFPKNGMRGIVEALVKLSQEVGVRFYTNQKIEGVVVNNRRVEAVRTQNGIFTCNLLVNNTDITYFYNNLMPNKKKFKKLMNRERSTSALIFNWGVNYTSNFDVHNILFSCDYKREFEAMFNQKTLADDLTVYIFISKKIVDADAPLGKENWFVMVNAPENIGQDWEALTKKAKQIAMKKIGNTIGINMEPLIEFERITTPVDIETRTASVNGSLYGHSSNSPFSAFLRHSNFSSKYKNLFFVGGSVHPGGGIPLCLASAKIVDQLIKTVK